ncbi:MAG TPA: glycosyltransferase family 87 protein [Anaerolineae bacterium]|nr:glycosyltransferase family 87 protein [Anaerolineae bacterium]
MGANYRRRRTILAILVLLSAAIVIRIRSTPGRGDGFTVPHPRDLAAYWGSATLLLHGQDPYDLQALLDLERSLGWTGPEPVVAWNPPIAQVLLLPLGAMSFQAAAVFWLIVNPVLIALAAICAWSRLRPALHRFAIIGAPILAFSFAPSLHTVLEGQITTFVLLGLVGYLFFRSRGQESLAGACCVALLVKPQLVYLLVPLLFVDAARERRWSAMTGFVVTLAAFLGVATYLYPGWPISYVQLLLSPFSPSLHPYVTPTVSSLLSVCFNTTIGRYLWVLVLPLAIGVFWRYGRGLDSDTLLNTALLGSLLTTPFAWASDQIVLLVPILQVVARATDYTPLRRLWVFTAVGFIFVYAWWFWVGDYQELPNLAVPLAITVLYGCAFLRQQRR